MKDKNLKIIIHPKYINGKPTVVLLEGTYCSNCNAFLAPPEATDDQRIQAAIDHTCILGGRRLKMPESEYVKKIHKAVKAVDKLVQTLIKDATAAKNALEELKKLGSKDGD